MWTWKRLSQARRSGAMDFMVLIPAQPGRRGHWIPVFTGMTVRAMLVPGSALARE